MSLTENYNLNYFEIEDSYFIDFCELISQLNRHYELKEQEEKIKSRAKDDWF